MPRRARGHRRDVARLSAGLGAGAARTAQCGNVGEEELLPLGARHHVEKQLVARPQHPSVVARFALGSTVRGDHADARAQSAAQAQRVAELVVDARSEKVDRRLGACVA